MFQTEFYKLPAHQLTEGMSTDDGQDITDVYDDGGDFISVTVYTPRSDDPEADEENRSESETRIYDRNEMVDLAVFEDTEVDGRDD